MTIYNTIDKTLKRIKKNWNDIEFIIVNDIEIDIKKFIKTIKQLNYNIMNIEVEVIIKFNDNSFLRLSDDDGPTYWEYIKIPERPAIKKETFDKYDLFPTMLEDENFYDKE